MTEPEAPQAEIPSPAAAEAPSVRELMAKLDALSARVTALEAAGQAPTVVAPTVVAPAPAAAPAADGLTEIKGLLRSLFAVALATDASDDVKVADQFEVFRTIIHSERQGTPLLDSDLRRYKWLPLLGKARDYLSDASQPGSFALERVLPDRIDARTNSVKVHVVVRGGRRMSPPVTFKRDPAAEGAFRIENMSL